MTIDSYLDKWKLSNPQELAKTPNGTIYKVDSSYGKSVLKIFTDVGKEDEANGTRFLDIYQSSRVVKLLNYDDDAQLLEHLSGSNLYVFSKENNELDASRVFVEIIKSFRQTNIPEIGKNFMTLEYLLEVFDRVSPPKEMDFLIDKAKHIGRELLRTEQERRLLHGDLHHENILKNKSGEYVCFDPKGIVADPAYELGTTLKNPWGYPQISHSLEHFKDRVKYFSRELNLPYERVISFAFVHVCLSIAWAIEDEGSYEHQESVARIINQVI